MCARWLQLALRLTVPKIPKAGRKSKRKIVIRIMKEDVDKKLFSEIEAANYFGWSVFTMREIRKRGEIDYLLFQEKTVRYTLQQIEDYRARHLKQAN